MNDERPTSHHDDTAGAAPPPRPLTIAAPEEPELIRCGLETQLEPFADRVRLLAAGEEAGTTAADVLLFDCFPPPDTGAPSAAIQPGTTDSVVVAYSWHTGPERIRWVLDHGFAGYLAKALTAVELVGALEAVHAGRRVVALPQALRATAPPNGARAALTGREAEILDLVCSGLSNNDIARRQHLSINSVKSYIRTAYRRIGVTTRSRAVVWGIEHGFGEVTDPITYVRAQEPVSTVR